MDTPTRSLRCLIAGCGDVGTRLGLALCAGGHEVFGLRRRPAELPGELIGIAADLATGRGLDGLPGGIDLLFVTVSAGMASGEDDYRRTYVDGPRHLCEAIATRPGPGPQRVVFTSSTSVYGQTDGSLVDEESPTEPVDFRGRVMLAAERQLAAGPWPAVVLRLGGIYGPGRTWLVDAVRTGRTGVSVDGRSGWTNRIHADDAARALLHVAMLPAPAPCYVAVDEEPARRDDVVRFLAERLGVEPPAVADDPLRTRGGDRRCSSARLRASGFRFRYPSYREGYAELLGG
ncbi:MAG: SDR family oxidoreductase [Planctomycetes bacterium]|nr:SDR family oxidoreductase [Planctomycetota bacterium]